MRRIDRYVLPPGCCFICRASKRDGEEWVLDVDRDVSDGQYEDARLYLCPQCCFAIADIAGCAPPGMRDRIVGERDWAIEHATALHEKVGLLEAALDALRLVAEHPVPAVELIATPKYACPECLEAGVPPDEADKQNPQGLASHRRARHGAAVQQIARGDDALVTADQGDPS